MAISVNDSIHRRIRQDLQRLHDLQLLREPRIVDVLNNGRCVVGGKEVINFGGNDYLGLAHEVGSAFDQTPRSQLGATASALVAGRSSSHAKLETQLASFEQTESALLFPTGYAANLGVITGLTQPGDAVFCDRDNHASIVDAIRLSEAKLLVYRSQEPDRLREALRSRRKEYNHAFIVTDGVFSMNGKVARLKELCDIADEFDASVIVDEAHGTGVIGESGRGASEYCNVEARTLVRVGTMSKAMGGVGGFAVGQSHVIDLLRNRARTQFFSTALPPAICDAMCESLNIIRSEPQRRDMLRTLGAIVREECDQAGLQVVPDGKAPIVPVIIPGDKNVLAASKALLTAGFFVPAIRSPTVSSGAERLRISFGVQHSETQLRSVVQQIASVCNENQSP